MNLNVMRSSGACRRSRQICRGDLGMDSPSQIGAEDDFPFHSLKVCSAFAEQALRCARIELSKHSVEDGHEQGGTPPQMVLNIGEHSVIDALDGKPQPVGTRRLSSRVRGNSSATTPACT